MPGVATISTSVPDGGKGTRSSKGRTPSPRKSKSGGRKRNGRSSSRGGNASQDHSNATRRTSSTTTPSISPGRRGGNSATYTAHASEHTRGELRGELKQHPQTRFPVMATSLPPTDTRPGVYEWRFGLQGSASVSNGRYDYYDEAEQAQMSRMNYPTVPEAMSLSRSAQHHDSPQSNGAGSQPPQLPSIVYSHSHPHGNGGGGGSAAAGNGMQYLAVQPGGRLSPRLLAAAAPPTNVRPTTRQAGNEFYTIPQIDMPKIKLRVRGNSARPIRPMSGMDPKRSSVLVHDWEAALNAASGKYNEPRPPPPDYLQWLEDGCPLPTWYVYGLNYDPDIWVDKKQLDGRTAEFVVYRKVFGVKADLGLRDSPKRNWKKLQQHLKIDIEAANWMPHPDIFDRVAEIRQGMRMAQRRMRRRSLLLQIDTARQMLAETVAKRAMRRGFNMATILFEEAQRKLAEEVERKRAAAYEAHMAELAKEEAALQELLRLRREEEEAARKAAAEGNEVDRLERERLLSELEAERAAAEAAAAAERAIIEAAEAAEEAVRLERLRLMEEKMMKAAKERGLKNMGHKWLLKARAGMARREAEERAARIQLKMLKLQKEIDDEYDKALAAGANKISRANTIKKEEEELAARIQTDRETNQIQQIRKCCKATIKWLEEERSNMLPGNRLSKDLLVNDAFSLPEEMVRESSKLKKKDKMTKKEMAYIREQNDKIHMMAENEQIPLAHGCKRPHIVLLSNKWQVTDMVLDPKTIRKFSDAIRETHPDDGNPIKLITFDWAMKAEDLLKKIEFAVKGTSKKLTPGDPEYFLKAKSFTFMVHHTTGSLFITKDMLTSMTTLSVPNQDNTRVRRWWSKIYDLLTCCGEDIVVGKVVGSRWNVEINCLGYTLDHTTYGETLEGVISTLLHCKVSATVDKQAYSKYFDMKKFKKAAQKMQNEKRSEAIGYDITNEDMTIRVGGKVKRKQEYFAKAW